MSIAKAQQHIRRARNANRMFVQVRRDSKNLSDLADRFRQAREIHITMARGCIERAGEQA